MLDREEVCIQTQQVMELNRDPHGYIYWCQGMGESASVEGYQVCRVICIKNTKAMQVKLNTQQK